MTEVHLNDEGPCPCGSGRAAQACCIRVFPVRKRDGRLVSERGIVVAQASPRPVPPATGKRVDGCYASCLNDCDGDLEGEDFVSHRMLKVLAGERATLKVLGIDPKDPALERRVAVKRMTANVLCARHNRALKPIDTAGNRLFETIATLGVVLEDAPTTTERIVALNGHDVERRCLKTLCGFLARAGTADRWGLPATCFRSTQTQRSSPDASRPNWRRPGRQSMPRTS